MTQSQQDNLRYPVDICYLVADLKYSAAGGVKICEIQQASLSMFSGDSFRNPEEESIHSEFLKVLSSYNQTGWIVGADMADKSLVSALADSKDWKAPADLVDLFSDPEFKKRSKQKPNDIHNLSSYHGILYSSWSQLSAIYDYEERLPGMVIVDKSSFPFWADKNRMTKLMIEDKRLSKFKPKSGIYKKKYSKDLANKIIKEIGGNTFVIKPRGNFLGKGVVIVQKNELDAVLSYVITNRGPLSGSKDPAYSAWQNDKYDSFIVEEFVASDPITLPHIDNKLYQPTMRIAFVLTYSNREHQVHFLGGYWKTPALALNEPGSFMDKNKDVCRQPFYCAVEPSIMNKAQRQLKPALVSLHKNMLNFSPDNSDGFKFNKPRSIFKVVRQ